MFGEGNQTRMQRNRHIVLTNWPNPHMQDLIYAKLYALVPTQFNVNGLNRSLLW